MVFLLVLALHINGSEEWTKEQDLEHDSFINKTGVWCVSLSILILCLILHIFKSIGAQIKNKVNFLNINMFNCVSNTFRHTCETNWRKPAMTFKVEIIYHWNLHYHDLQYLKFASINNYSPFPCVSKFTDLYLHVRWQNRLFF